jgi:hypothetical protein
MTMPTLDLFGQPDTATVRLPGQPKPRAKRDLAHADKPGTGPADETCRTCDHYCRVKDYTAGTFLKCGLTRATWSRGPGTDLHARDAACARWTAKSKETPYG